MGCGNEGLDRDLQDERKIECGASVRWVGGVEDKG